MRLGYIKGSGLIIDEVVVSFMKAPHTYTRENIQRRCADGTFGETERGEVEHYEFVLKFERAIVTPAPGTIRDVIEEQLNLDGIPFILADTAGITESEDLIKNEGVKRSRAYMDREH